MRRRAAAMTLALGTAVAVSFAVLAAPGPPPARVAPDAAVLDEPERVEGELFASWVGKYQDLTYAGLVDVLGVPAAPRDGLSFSPRKDAAYFDLVSKALGLDARAQDALDANGLVLLDPEGRAYSMGAALYEIYTSDLPLLVTTDVVLDAMHRSFDTILSELEENVLANLLEQALRDARDRAVAAAKTPGMAQAARDADLYLTVALNLLMTDPSRGRLSMVPLLAGEDEILTILKKVDSLQLENPGMGGGSTQLYGSSRAVDWSQYKPRGHYDKTEKLQRYFRAMMWLGRADSGFELDKPRQLRLGSLIAMALAQGEGGKKLDAIRDVVDLMVGPSDELTPGMLAGVLASLKLTAPGSLAGAGAMKRVAKSLAESGLGRQRIRSEVVVSDPAIAAKTPLPEKMQVFGQRFVLDSFVLSKVVYDDIVFEGSKQPRMMPTGLDVMAAFGSDEAVRLLKPELETWKYGANLAALRDVVAAQTPAQWEASMYAMWLDALRTLSATPAGAHVPEVMKTQAWARKTLQTQLSSWAQLRHDTILYAKQSYTASVGCVYPKAYVEPYPAFYAKLERFATAASAALGALPRGAAFDPYTARYKGYFANFAATMKKLRTLAEKELAAQPFTAAEEAWLKKTIEKSGGGGGYGPAPTWDGWYIDLVYIPVGGEPEDAVKFEPTIADVHTDPDSATVLEVGTGRAHFAVVAIDNDGDRAVYVGPSFSYYEFRQPASDRMTDETWTSILWSRNEPKLPDWIAPYTSTTKIP